ncbi:MAG: RrF2 family transcriptional regulator [Candidatus Saccharibacteria bacterium]
MKLSTKGRYGLRAMLDMALHQDQGPITVNSIADREGLSDRYLEQLMVPLKKVGLVKSVRGAQGGYILAKEPKDITVGDIIRALEGPVAPVDCVSEDRPEECSRSEACVTRIVWAKIRDSISEVLDSFTLEDLVIETKKRAEAIPEMYYI